MKFRWLQAGYVDGCYYEAGQIAEMPATFVPSGAVEPLDPEGARAFWNAGPSPLGLVRQQWSHLLLQTYPTTYWKQINKDEFQLTGLGASLGPKKATRSMEVLP
jgi:hypothetical protein